MSILSERRAFQPYGLCGGQPGARGLNLLFLRSADRLVSLGGKNTVSVLSGDRLTIYTPGGGGYGTPLKEGEQREDEETNRKTEDKGVARLTSGSLLQYTLNQESV